VATETFVDDEVVSFERNFKKKGHKVVIEQQAILDKGYTNEPSLPIPCPPPTDAEIRALGYIMPFECPPTPDPGPSPSPDPGGVLIWTDGFENKYIWPTTPGQLAKWIPQINRLFGDWNSGIITYVGDDQVRFWNSQERDNARGHHTMFEPNFGDAYANTAGRALITGPRYLISFKVLFESGVHGGTADPKWNIFWQEKPHASVNPGLIHPDKQPVDVG